MLVAHLILLYLYFCLILVYIATSPKPIDISPWGTLPAVPEALKPIVHCQVDSDCESGHVCLGSTCVRKLLRGGKCRSATGSWISYQLRNATFAVCVCHDDRIFSQKFFGGDCNVSVACGVHGKYDPATQTCHCDDRYKPVGLTCQKLPVMDYKNSLPACKADELEVAQTDLEREGFHVDYIARLQSSAKCVKRPCSFDALTGRPLKRTRYEAGWGCVCDPRYGLFGVHLEGSHKRYLVSPGFDACASILTEEPSRPMSVQLVTYFYLRDRPPLSIILFEKVPKNYLTPFFKRKRDPFMVTQSLWRYDFAQTFFKENGSFRARTRKVISASHVAPYSSRTSYVNNHVYVNNFQPTSCNYVYDMIKNAKPLRKEAMYRMLYENPVCRVAPSDPFAHPMFRERVVLNPNHLTFDKDDTLPFFNAFVLKFEAGILNRWTFDLDYAYDIDKYRAFRTNAPDYSDAIPPYRPAHP